MWKEEKKDGKLAGDQITNYLLLVDYLPQRIFYYGNNFRDYKRYFPSIS